MYRATPPTKSCARPIRSGCDALARIDAFLAGHARVSRRYDIAIVGAGMAGASLAAEIAGARLGAAARGGGAARLSRHRPLRRFLVGNLWRAADPAADQRARAARSPRYPEPARRDPYRRRRRPGGARRAGRRVRRRPSRSSGWTGPRSRRGCRGFGPAGTRASTSRAAPTSTSPRSTSPTSPGAPARGRRPGRRRARRRRRAARRWRLADRAGTFEADILVNAAGAWADEVAAMAGERPIGIQPYRRTIAQLRVDPPAAAGPAAGDRRGRPLLLQARGGRPAVAQPARRDALPTLRLRAGGNRRRHRDRPARAGRRLAGASGSSTSGRACSSFAPDRLPVYGFAARARGFFWCAGQGGFGIQTAPAAAALARRLLLGQPPGAIDPAPYLAARFG